MIFNDNRQAAAGNSFFIGLFTIVISMAIMAGGFATEAYAQKPGHHHAHGKKHLRHHASAGGFYVPQPASFIVDADTGKVLEQENPDSPRYPASLTKMMTLYLTFDALKKGTMRFDQMLPVSEHASSMPQTNIALQPGDHIAVKDAILSIVIRSANDSAVTLGEALGGGSEETFAQKMTATARSLGMKNTVFYNASGLPEPAQHTTAHDMAVLGMALRRNFPAYFPFFKTESFSFRGKTYVTHNHVMMRYEGVDGIKTGFIRASGFNLVTSATRDGHHLVAVVLGGYTSRARDDKMIALLDRTFTQLAMHDGNKTVQVAALAPRKVAAFPAKAQPNEENQEGEGDLTNDEAKDQPASPMAAAEAAQARMATATNNSAAVAAPEQKVAMLSPAAGNPNAGWGIQVGAYAKMNDAKQAATAAMTNAPQELAASKMAITDDTGSIHRARLYNLTQLQAESACKKLNVLRNPCFAYRIN